VDAVNERELDDLEGEAVVFTATDDGDPDALDAGTRAPRVLRLKPGASVMLTRNAAGVDARLVNGARGVVVGFEKGRDGGGCVLPVVRFAAGGRPRALPRVAHTLAGGGRRFQVPLAHAAALSIHKAQGMTLDAVEVDVGAAFEAGMAYVALSRATTAAGLRLLGALTLDALAPDPDVVAFYGELEGSARRAREGGVGAPVAPRVASSPVGCGGGLRIKF
jgi:ATP-dependent DNA helicase PIF1